MNGISKRFGATVALSNVSFEVAPAEVHALVGENGAGKSTLMKVLSGALTAEAGSMCLDNADFVPKEPLDARHKGVGMIYQELSLAPHLTVEENMLLGMEPVKFGFVQRNEVRRRALLALAHFQHPEIRPDSRAGDLSVAAQQLVEIGRALAVGCRVLVLDEPTSSLSQEDIKSLFGIILELKSKGIAIVYISHFLEEVSAIADRLTVLRDGAAVGTHRISDISNDEIVSLMVGRKVDDLYPRSHRSRGEPMLELTEISGMQKPESASLVLYSGEILGIFGLVGAGRTELMRAIFGLDPIRNGNLKIGSFSGTATPQERWRQGVGMLSEDRKNEGLALNLSIADNVTLSKMDGLGPGAFVTPGGQAKAAGVWIERLNIRCLDGHQQVCDISGGNQQKIALARLLHHNVDILLLDEPTRGIDVAAKATIYQVIDALVCSNKDTRPKSVLMIGSYLPELLGVCDRVAVMARGWLSPAWDVKDVTEHELMLLATGQADNLTDESR
jgi:ribose transport system ATP-binding protein